MMFTERVKNPNSKN